MISGEWNVATSNRQKRENRSNENSRVLAEGFGEIGRHYHVGDTVVIAGYGVPDITSKLANDKIMSMLANSFLFQ